MDQFKVQAALSNMVAPISSSVNSGEKHNGQQQAADAGAAAAAAVGGVAPPPNPSAGAPGGNNDQKQDLNSLMNQGAPSKQDAAPGTNGGGASNQHHPVAEFLYQLTKMLTDDNSEIIEWVDGRIKVHHPERLESEVLHKYFRHSKFASFQRQLNYFGFRKIAGKGKMSPCSYVNENATSDIRSLLVIKRKTNGSAARKAMAQRAMSLQAGMNPALGTGIPGLTGAPGLAGLSSLNQLQMQQQLGLQQLGMFQGNNDAIAQLLAQNQHQQQVVQPKQQQSWNDLQQLGGLKPNMPSIEQLQAQLTALQQNQGGASAALNAAAFNLASGGAGGLNLSQFSAAGGAPSAAGENPATAALNASSAANPATAAMNASAAAGQSNNLFDSATNLKALIGNDNAGNEAAAAQQQQLLNRLPSTNGMFPGSVSNASLGNLLASSNRLSSLLSLNSFLSREPSLADLAMLPNGAQLAALGVQQNQQDIAKRLNPGSS